MTAIGNQDYSAFKSVVSSRGGGGGRVCACVYVHECVCVCMCVVFLFVSHMCIYAGVSECV